MVADLGGINMAGSFKGGEKLAALLKQYEKNLGDEPSVSVGFFSGSRESKTDQPTAYVALCNEYGTKNAPPRPFFRNMVINGKPNWGKNLGAYLISENMNSSAALNDMGMLMKEQLQESIQAPGYAPLAESTIARKGNAQTLIDSSDMINAVDFQVDE